MSTFENNYNQLQKADITSTEAKELMCEKLLNCYEDGEPKSQAVLHQYVSPRMIIGSADQFSSTKGTIDWSYNGLVAYGSNRTVVVIDMTNMQLVQCLDHHKSIVNHVLWNNQMKLKDKDCPSPVELVTSDLTGHIIHWDISIGTALVVLQDGNKPVLGMEWVPGERHERLLATLHFPHYLILWDICKQSKLWKKGFNDNMLGFQFNPFNTSEIALMCLDCVLFLDDFNPIKTPSSNGRKFMMSNSYEAVFLENTRTKDNFKRMVRGLVVGDFKQRSDNTLAVCECLGFSYHKSLRHHMLLIYAKGIIIIDLLIDQTVGIITNEKSMAPLLKVITVKQRDMLYFLHESGIVNVKIGKKIGATTNLSSPVTTSIDNADMSLNHHADFFLNYENSCQSEVIRQIKGSKVMAIALDPITERNIVLLLSSGKILHLELETFGSDAELDNYICLKQMFRPTFDENYIEPSLRLITVGLLSAIANPVTVIRMCPPLTTRNRSHYIPLMAVGTFGGLVQVYNMATGVIEKEFALHNYPVRGIEWTSLTSFLTYAYSGKSSNVVNELLLTDVHSGQALSLPQKGPTQNPIDIIRVSHLRQYFVVIYKDGPFELWDLRSLKLLRTMPKKFPCITALEWSPVHSVKYLHTKADVSKSIEDSTFDTTLLTESGGDLLAKENLVFSDTESQLYHFSVKGSTVRDGIKIPPESGVSLVTYIAFKGNQIVQADVDGCLNIWDLKSRSSRNSHTGRGWIRKIRFSPGKGNLKLLILYSDGVDIVDIKNLQFERLAQLKCPKNIVKIIDIDWAAPDTPVLATEDGCLRIMDCNLNQSHSSISEYTFKEPVFCPAMLPEKVFKHLHFYLSSSKLNSNHCFTVEEGFPLEQLKAINEQVEMMKVNTLDNNEINSAGRCLSAALLLRDQSGIDFWTVCCYYLQVLESSNNSECQYMQEEPEDSFSVADFRRINHYPNFEPLDTCYDVLQDSYYYQKLQLEKVSVHEWRRGDYKHTQNVIERLILLGQIDRAVQLLLETELDNENYYADSIKACLLATVQSTGAAQSTIKLVATNLIANGKIWEGVQLLCLIGKGLDGCRYLSSYGLWESAVWLAKSTLHPLETLEIMRKWADHLFLFGEKEIAKQIMVSQYQMDRVIELLLIQGQFVRAQLLLTALHNIHYPIDKELSASVTLKFFEEMHHLEPKAGAD